MQVVCVVAEAQKCEFHCYTGLSASEKSVDPIIGFQHSEGTLNLDGPVYS